MDLPVLIVLFVAVAYFTYSSRGRFAYTFGIYLDLPNVIIHECGHALTARLWGGSIQSIKFNVLPANVKNSGILGLAEIGNRSGLGMFFSLLGGYVSQALFFVVMSYLYLEGLLLWIIPLFLGIMRSRITRFGFLRLNSSIACSPSNAELKAKRSADR